MIYIVLGRRELGKTTLADRMLKSLDLRFVIDARRMINQRDPSIIYEHDSASASAAMFEALESAGTYKEVIYQPHEDDLEKAFRDWTRTLKEIAIQYPARRIGVLIDEASFYNLDETTFQWLAKCTPRECVHIFLTAHQPKDVPTSIRSIADHWFIFYMSQRTDLDRIAEKSPEAAAQASTLTDRGYVHWDDTKARMQVNRNASSWFIRLNEGA